jgi:hypothetical protein
MLPHQPLTGTRTSSPLASSTAADVEIEESPTAHRQTIDGNDMECRRQASKYGRRTTKIRGELPLSSTSLRCLATVLFCVCLVEVAFAVDLSKSLYPFVECCCRILDDVEYSKIVLRQSIGLSNM